MSGIRSAIDEPILVLDRLAGDIANEVSFAAAAANVNAQADVVDMQGFNTLTVTIDLTVGGPANLFVANRGAFEVGAVKTTPTDWSVANRVYNPDLATGIDTSQPLVEQIPVIGVGKYTVVFPRTLRYNSVVVWGDAVSGRGTVHVTRSNT